MPTKYRTITISPIEQSSAMAYINAIWIKPLLRLRPSEMSVAAWLNFLFVTHERSIEEWVSTKDLLMPGLLMELPARIAHSQRKVFRKIKSGSSIWARKDTTTPNRIEIETTNGVGGRVQLFQLTGDEWANILVDLRRAPKRRKKIPLPSSSTSKPNVAKTAA